MKQHMFVITLSFVIVLAVHGTGLTQEPDLQCRIYIAKAEACESTLSLEKGELALMGKDQFSLNGFYNSCYHREDVVLTGKYNTTTFTERMVFELLASKYWRNGEPFQDFPRTVGVIIVNNETMEGVFYDIWSLTRSPGASIQSPAIRTVTCKKPIQ